MTPRTICFLPFNSCGTILDSTEIRTVCHHQRYAEGVCHLLQLYTAQHIQGPPWWELNPIWLYSGSKWEVVCHSKVLEQNVHGNLVLADKGFYSRTYNATRCDPQPTPHTPSLHSAPLASSDVQAQCTMTATIARARILRVAMFMYIGPFSGTSAMAY